MLSLIAQLFRFAVENKKFWMIPAVLLLLGVGGLIVALQASTVAPFIYALF